tara:strand:+ start:14476 stop:15051 length:576 start_codon:yes stop_codon:yes gene_type:complete
MAIQHTLYISTDRLKKDTSLGGSVSNDLLFPYILMAQDRYILPILGTDLHNKLISDIQGSSLAGNYLTLLQTYIQPALVQFSYATVLPFLRLRMVNNAIVTMNSEQGSSVSHSDLKPLINAALDQGEFYRQRLIDYLTNTTFTEYTSNSDAGDLSPTTANYYAGLNLDVSPSNERMATILRKAGVTIVDCN